MGVYVKDMEMPKSCWDCPCINGENGYCKLRKEYVYGDISRSCPLVPIPPHGDLIDRDALMKDGWLSLWKRVDYMGGYAVHDLPLINPSIPVVIEREYG